MSAAYVQYGCALTAPEGWANFDASPRLRLERLPGARALLGRRAYFPAGVRFGDIVAGLPLPDGAARGVYCSHVLEHIPRADIGTALMTALLERAGFTGIRRCGFGDCADPAFAAVEEHKRFVDKGFDELAMECRRPDTGAPATTTTEGQPG